MKKIATQNQNNKEARKNSRSRKDTQSFYKTICFLHDSKQILHSSSSIKIGDDSTELGIGYRMIKPVP